jgi:hypothetical protein
VVLASASVIIGLLWDISWHRTIGRDRFLTPAHVAIYLGGLIAGLSCGARVLWITFAPGAQAERDASVGFWGFRGPLGGWLCIWGSFAMLTSAPFDNWWHNAYGLDVEILSPPHTVLGLGMIGIEIGALLIVLAHQNRHGEDRATRWMYAICAGIALLMAATIVWEYTGFPNQMHSSLFYQVCAGVMPLFLLGPARASRLRWPATSIAAVYMGLTLAMMWILPLVPAVPMLAPIYNPMTHLQPPTFPLWLIVPAVAFDLLVRRFGAIGNLRLALLLSLAFLATMLPIQWFFSEFLLTPAARGPLFAADHWSYSSVLGPWRYRYWDLEKDAGGQWSAAMFWRGIGVAFVLGTAISWLGLGWGRWMTRVQR